MAASNARAQQRHRETPSRGSPQPRVSAGPVSMQGKDFVAEVLSPLCSANVPRAPTLASPSGFLGTKQGADRVGRCTAPDAGMQMWDPSTPAPSLHPSHPEIPRGCRNIPAACSQDHASALGDTGTSTISSASACLPHRQSWLCEICAGGIRLIPAPVQSR